MHMGNLTINNPSTATHYDHQVQLKFSTVKSFAVAKLAVLAAVLLVALLALAQASTYTTITTTVIEEDNPHGGPHQRCSEQVQRQQLRQCSMYLSQRGSPYEALMEENPEREMSGQLRQCCQELRNIDQQCRCEAIRQVVRRQQQGQQGQWQGEKMQQVVQKAQSLPQRCNMRQPQKCEIRAIWF